MGVCTNALPGTDCTPMRHAPGCRYAGTEPRVLILKDRQRRLIDLLSSPYGLKWKPGTFAAVEKA